MNIKKLTRKLEALIVAIAAICVCSLSFVFCEDDAKSNRGAECNSILANIKVYFNPQIIRII
jgi:hypothetical protein